MPHAAATDPKRAAEVKSTAISVTVSVAGGRFHLDLR